MQDPVSDHISQASIRKILKTNSVPSQDQAVEIRGLIARNKSQPTDYYATYASVVRSTFEISSLQTHIHDLEALLSPARALATELISIIFEFFVSMRRVLPTPNPRKAPLLLTHICADWRRIAISTPKICGFVELCLFYINL